MPENEMKPLEITDEQIKWLAQIMWEGDFHEVSFSDASDEARDSTLNMARAALSAWNARAPAQSAGGGGGGGGKKITMEECREW